MKVDTKLIDYDIIDYDITDHYPVMAIINRNVNSNPSQPIFIRSFNKFNSSNFVNDLQLRLDNFFPANEQYN